MSREKRINLTHFLRPCFSLGFFSALFSILSCLDMGGLIDDSKQTVLKQEG